LADPETQGCSPVIAARYNQIETIAEDQRVDPTAENEIRASSME